jgi:transcriptional regulator with XRE-family HTH domain
MGSRERAVEAGAARARDILSRVTAEAREARLSAGLGQDDVARALGISRSQYSRIERGASSDLTIDRVARLFTILGMDLAVRAYPAGDPIRDAAQVALLGRLRERCHPSIRWRTEVAFPIPGDLRAWDATAICPAFRAGVEAETRIRDVQALDRRMALKERDGGMDRLILVVLDSRSNRSALRSAEAILRARFPIRGARALDLLGAAVDPGSNALIVL